MLSPRVQWVSKGGVGKGRATQAHTLLGAASSQACDPAPCRATKLHTCHHIHTMILSHVKVDLRNKGAKVLTAILTKDMPPG